MYEYMQMLLLQEHKILDLSANKHQHTICLPNFLVIWSDSWSSYFIGILLQHVEEYWNKIQKADEAQNTAQSTSWDGI
jgi:hypothetical protein